MRVGGRVWDRYAVVSHDSQLAGTLITALRLPARPGLPIGVPPASSLPENVAAWSPV